MSESRWPTSAYVHVPFCHHRCGYCNFTLIAGRDEWVDGYLRAVKQEIQAVPSGLPLQTLFLGGGTPTYLTAKQLASLLEFLTTHFQLQPGFELSVEANPVDITRDKLQVLQQFGINRISLGVQSFQAEKLKLLERDHTPDEAKRAIELSLSFIAKVSVDLIFGAPGESLSSWETDLHTLIATAPHHASTYGLTFEKGTQFWSRRNRGELIESDEDLSAEMYRVAIATLGTAGFEHYEISNFAKAGCRSTHNQVYWRGKEYFAFGPGASRYVGGERATNHRSTVTYVKRLLAGEDATAERDPIAHETRARERLVFGLRMLEGVSLEEFRSDTEFDAMELAGAAIEKYSKLGLLEFDKGRLRLTAQGLVISDSLWPEFF